MYSFWYEQLEIRHVIIQDDCVIMEVCSRHGKQCLYVVLFSDVFSSTALLPEFKCYPIDVGKSIPLTAQEENRLCADTLRILSKLHYN